jgi:hypothetical protein
VVAPARLRSNSGKMYAGSAWTGAGWPGAGWTGAGWTGAERPGAGRASAGHKPASGASALPPTASSGSPRWASPTRGRSGRGICRRTERVPDLGSSTGAKWRLQPSPNGPGSGAYNRLTAVAALSPSSAAPVGHEGAGSGRSRCGGLQRRLGGRRHPQPGQPVRHFDRAVERHKLAAGAEPEPVMSAPAAASSASSSPTTL